MNGLELSEKFYNTYGAPMLQSQFPQLLPQLAVGLLGAGSECLGFDDEVSHDHDFEPGFCILLPDESLVSRQDAFLLERAYAALPKEFKGFRRAAVSPVGGSRHGVLRSADFFLEHIGSADGQLTVQDWLTLSEQSLLEVTGGALFFDGFGEVSAVRERLSYLPEDIRRKKLAGNLLLMAQAGQYNYPRCIARGETGAAQLALGTFVNAAFAAAFLLNRRYLPYYKWRFRALRMLPQLPLLDSALEYLLSTGNDAENAAAKQELVESIAIEIIELLQRQELTKASCGDLEKHAYSVNDSVADASLRNLHILCGV